MHYDDGDSDEETMAVEYQKESSSSLTYLSTDHSTRTKSTSTLRSLQPPRSWPSLADLSQDSDVYPIEVLPTLEVSKTSLDSNAEFGPFSKLLVDRVQLPSTEKQKTVLDESSVDKQERLECIEICGPICVCPSVESTPRLSINRVSTRPGSSSQLEDLQIPEFDIPPIGNFVTLPMNTNYLRKLCFSETLIVSRDKNNPEISQDGAGSMYPKLLEDEAVDEIGGMCISIERVEANIVTYCTSQFSFENGGATSSILSVINNRFKMLEEKRTEALHSLDDNEEKTLHVFKEDDQYVAVRTMEKNQSSKRQRGDIKLQVEGDLILDGAGFVLMRYLILTKFTGDIQVWTMHITGEICRAVYNVGKRKVLMINNRPRETIRIVKLMFRHNRKVDISKTYFLTTGHIVRHRWMGCPYFLHVNPLTEIPPCKYFESLEHTWENDIQMFSQYLDFKEERKSDIQSYMKDNGEIKSMIKDYLLCLLRDKPSYVLDFTIEYFQNLLCRRDSKSAK